MKNNIAIAQNKKENLEKLAAQRYIYFLAKRIFAIQIILSIPFMIILSIVAIMKPELQVYKAYYAIVLVFLDDIIFKSLIESYKKQAAKIQESFDCDVLNIPWSDVKVGSKIDAETIFKYSQKYKSKGKDFSDFLNWYTQEIANIDISFARIICQRTNCWWDIELRNKYILWVMFIFICFCIVTMLFGITLNFSLESLIINILTPLLPAYVLCIRQYRDQKETMKSLTHFKEIADKLWIQVINKKIKEVELEKISRALQDEIYNHRCKNSLVFDWIYEFFKKEQSEQMEKGIENFINDVNSIKN